MKKQLKYLIICIGLLLYNCKDENKKERVESDTKTEQIEKLSKAEKTEIVKYYLINDRKLTKENFHEIIFIENPLGESVKVIYFEGKDAYFGFPFLKALEFYNSNKK